MAFTAILIAGSVSNFATIDWDELDSSDVADEVSAIPGIVQTSQTAILGIQRSAPAPTLIPSLKISSVTVQRDLVALSGSYCQHENIRERAPPILQI